MSNYSTLSIDQKQVLSLISHGATVTRAAEIVGIHRNRITQWRQGSAEFREAWAEALYDQEIYWRDEVQSVANVAIEAVVGLIVDRSANPHVRLKAALQMLSKLVAPPPAQPSRSVPSAAGERGVIANWNEGPPLENPRIPISRTVNRLTATPPENVDPELFGPNFQCPDPLENAAPKPKVPARKSRKFDPWEDTPIGNLPKM